MCDASRGVVNKTNAASECGSIKVLLPDRITTGRRRTAVSRTVMSERTVRAVRDQVLKLKLDLESRTGLKVTRGDGMLPPFARHVLFFISPRKAGSVGVLAHMKNARPEVSSAHLLVWRSSDVQNCDACAQVHNN